MEAVAQFLLSPVYRESRCLAGEVLVPMIQKALGFVPTAGCDGGGRCRRKQRVGGR